jgi:hypothetical protein
MARPSVSPQMKYPIWPDEESCGWESNPAKKTKIKTKTAHRCGDRGTGAHKKNLGKTKRAVARPDERDAVVDFLKRRNALDKNGLNAREHRKITHPTFPLPPRQTKPHTTPVAACVSPDFGNFILIQDSATNEDSPATLL